MPASYFNPQNIEFNNNCRHKSFFTIPRDSTLNSTKSSINTSQKNSFLKYPLNIFVKNNSTGEIPSGSIDVIVPFDQNATIIWKKEARVGNKITQQYAGFQEIALITSKGEIYDAVVAIGDRGGVNIWTNPKKATCKEAANIFFKINNFDFDKNYDIEWKGPLSGSRTLHRPVFSFKELVLSEKAIKSGHYAFLIDDGHKKSAYNVFLPPPNCAHHKTFKLAAESGIETCKRFFNSTNDIAYYDKKNQMKREMLDFNHIFSEKLMAYYNDNSNIKIVIDPSYSGAHSEHKKDKNNPQFSFTFGAISENSNWTSLDIVGHEYIHYLNHFTAQLPDHEEGVYNEAYMLIEGIADVFALLIEGTQGTIDWVVGDKVFDDGIGIRNLKSPKLLSFPKVYKGKYWCNSGGIMTNCSGGDAGHTNSTVLGHWFYLLAMGGKGWVDDTPSRGEFFVNGVGVKKAANILFHAFTNKLDSEDGFKSAAQKTMESAHELYGQNSETCSETVKAVYRAWGAVGVSLNYEMEEPCRVY